MTEREIRIAMLPKWRAVQRAYIERCGGDFAVMAARESERRAMEAPLIAEYQARCAALTQA